MAYKKCPFCAEEILEEAILCKHCGSDLTDLTVTNNNIPNNISTEKILDKRTLELVFGLLGGIGGLFSGIFALLFGGVDAAFSSTGTSVLGSLGIAAILFSIIAIVGAIIVKKNGKIGGLLMTLAAVGGFISVFVFYIIPGILLIIPGIMSLKKPIQKNKEFKLKIWIPTAIALVALVFIFSKGGSDYADTPVSLDEVEKYNISDSVAVGELNYIIKSAHATKNIKGEYSTEEAQGIFLILDVDIINNAKEAKTIDSSLFKLVLDDGTKFEPTSSTILEMDGNNGLFLEKINPTIKLNGYVMFDVPDIDHEYVLELSAGMFDSNVSVKESLPSIHQ